MFDPRMQLMLAEARRNNLAKEVKKIRASQAARAARPRFSERFLLRIGDLLISTGSRLHERYRPAVYPRPEVC